MEEFNSIEAQKTADSPALFKQNSPKSSDLPKKSNKKLTAFFVILAILGFLAIIVLPMVLKAINPEKRFAEATLKTCNKECLNSRDTVCVSKCMEKSGLKGMLTPAKVSVIPAANLTPIPKYYLQGKDSTGQYKDLINFNGGVNIVRYKNLLIYGSNDLNIYDLDSKKAIYNYKFNDDGTSGEKRIDSLQVYKNKLYIFYGEYFSGVKIYSIPLDLLTKSDPKSAGIDSNIHSRLQQLDDLDLLISETANNFGEVENVGVVNLESGTNNNIMNFNNTSTSSINLIGIYEKQFIISEKTSSGPLRGAEGHYLNLSAVPFSNVLSKNGLIANSDFPPDITDMKMIKDKNTLILIGKNIYLYDLQSKNLVKKIELPKEIIPAYINVYDEKDIPYLARNQLDSVFKSSYICINYFDYKISKEKKLEYDYSTDQFNKSNRCDKGEDPYNLKYTYGSDTFEQIFNKLKLPLEYKLKKE